MPPPTESDTTAEPLSELISMEGVVADSSLLVAYFLESDVFHQSARKFVADLDSGGHKLHLPMLVMVETVSAIRRRLGQNAQTTVNDAFATIYQWEREEKVVFYPLNRERMEAALGLAEGNALRGADSIVAALSEELGIALKTYDNEILRRFMRAI